MMRLLKHREIQLLAAIIALVLLISLRVPLFLTPASLGNVYNDTSILIILALGQMGVILTRCVDLSMAANLALCGMVTAMLNMAFPGLPVPLLILAAIALGAVLGSINGLLVWKLDMPPIVATLGTMTIFRGSIFLLTDGKWINAHQMSAAYKAFPRDLLLGIPVLSWVSVVVVLIMLAIISRTALGRSFFAVGGNERAARMSGIRVDRVKMFVYMFSGFCAGIVGLVISSELMAAHPATGTNLELNAIAAAVLGGTSMSGGRGTIGGTIIGAFVIGILSDGLVMMGVSSFWQMVIKGLVIIVAVVVDQAQRKMQQRVTLMQMARAG